jgi:membrane protease YdiL (CAAX protease family)
MVEVAALACLAATLVLLRKRWTMENLTVRLAIILLCFYAGLVLSVWSENLAGQEHRVPSARQMLVGMVSFQGAILVLTGWFLREQGTTWKEAFGFANRWRVALLWGILAACVFLPIGDQIQQLCKTIIEHWSRSPFEPEEQLPVQTLRLAASFGKRLILGIATVALAPAAEETLFRGILYPAIKQAGYPKLALWLTSVAFAGMHANAVAFLPLMVLSLVLTGLYEKTGNLLAPMIAHALFNSIELVHLFLQS